jgi:transcription elongation factor Elf1
MSKDILNESPSVEEALNYYQHKFYCSNCGNTNYRYIRKGVKITEVVTVCDNCGCGISLKFRLAVSR